MKQIAAASAIIATAVFAVCTSAQAQVQAPRSWHDFTPMTCPAGQAYGIRLSPSEIDNMGRADGTGSGPMVETSPSDSFLRAIESDSFNQSWLWADAYSDEYAFAKAGYDFVPGETLNEGLDGQGIRRLFVENVLIAVPNGHEIRTLHVTMDIRALMRAASLPDDDRILIAAESPSSGFTAHEFRVPYKGYDENLIAMGLNPLGEYPTTIELNYSGTGGTYLPTDHELPPPLETMIHAHGLELKWASTAIGQESQDLLTALNEMDEPALDIAIAVMHAVDYLNVEWCSEPVNPDLGMTWNRRLTEHPITGIVTVGCAGGDYDCNPFQGDTVCTRELPLLCFNDLDAQSPTSFVEPNRNNRWAGGIVHTTAPVAASTLPTLADANAVCEREFGTGWRVAEFHDGWGWNFTAYGNVGDAEARFWTDITDQADGTCWSR